MLYRNESDKMIAGVSGGLARYFNLDVTLFRLGFVLLAFANGIGVWVYLLLWVVVPVRKGEDQSEDDFHPVPLQENPVAIKFLGGALVLFGVFAFLDNLNIFRWLRMDTLWPLFVIAAGALMIRRSFTNKGEGENKDE